MSTIYVGIDPGITGAIGVIYADDNFYIWDVPTKKIQSKLAYNFPAMHDLLKALSFKYKTFLTLERQQAMPRQGVSSTFQTGRGYGAWEAICSSLLKDFEIVSPRKWKKALELTNDKEMSRLKAISLYPQAEHRLTRKRDHNRAEALLLAHYTKVERNKVG